MSNSLKGICGNCGKHCGKDKVIHRANKVIHRLYSTDYPQEKNIKMGARAGAAKD